MGGSGAGKSTLSLYLMRMWLAKPNRKLVIFDTKPRWRAQWLPSGRSATSRYKGWRHGDVFPDSISVTTMHEWEIAKRNWRPQPVIVQPDLGDEADLELQATIAWDIYRSMPRDKSDVMIYVDETMDHFNVSTHPKVRAGSVWAQICRGGRELGLSALYATQRPAQIPLSILQEMSFLWLFYIKDDEDVKRLYRMGFPRTAHPPERLHEFLYWRALEKRVVWGPYTLDIRTKRS
ncbi:MAG: hypothetical protein QXU98_13185 [Candidatus Parvarchaeota archaeon]